MAVLPWYRRGCWSASVHPHWTIVATPKTHLVIEGFVPIRYFDKKKGSSRLLWVAGLLSFVIILCKGADLTVLLLLSLQQDSLHNNQQDGTTWTSAKDEKKEKNEEKRRTDESLGDRSISFFLRMAGWVSRTAGSSGDFEFNRWRAASVNPLLSVAPSKAQVPHRLNPAIVQLCHEALLARGVFATIALSGGSLPSLLSPLQAFFDAVGIDPQWDKWHVLLADGWRVPVSDADSNLGALQATLLKNVGIPSNQVYGIEESKMSNAKEIAEAYESIVRNVLSKSNGRLALAVLGFGPDGHTCFLFPGHALLQDTSNWVAPITDSPKTPLNRITLTFPVLNDYTRNVIFCGAGSSKAPILKDVFGQPRTQIGADSRNNKRHSYFKKRIELAKTKREKKLDKRCLGSLPWAMIFLQRGNISFSAARSSIPIAPPWRSS
jgi:6-phosphogluconolactonase